MFFVTRRRNWKNIFASQSRWTDGTGKSKLQNRLEESRAETLLPFDENRHHRTAAGCEPDRVLSLCFFARENSVSFSLPCRKISACLVISPTCRTCTRSKSRISERVFNYLENLAVKERNHALCIDVVGN